MLAITVIMQLHNCLRFHMQNMFWLLNNLNPHGVLSFDRLHSNNSGLFRYHLWDLFKTEINWIGCGAAVKVDQQYGF